MRAQQGEVLLNYRDPRSFRTYSGFGRESAQILKKLEEIPFRRESPLSFPIESTGRGYSRRAAFQSLDEISIECGEDNWDGFDAAHISTKTLEAARNLLKQLPSYFPVPEVSAEPDGDINFEWYKSNQFVFEISVTESGNLFYAGRYHEQKVNGRVDLAGALEEVLRENIKRFL